jgi:hypothetical protein
MRRSLLSQWPAQRDLAAGDIGIFGHECREPGLWADGVEESARKPSVKAADDRLALAHGVAVRAVVQAVGHSVRAVEASHRLEAHRDQDAIDLGVR